MLWKKSKGEFMRISCYGAPGSGKDTTACRIFSYMKIKHYNIELVTEVVKEWTYIGRTTAGWDQPYLFGSQLLKEIAPLRGGFEHIVTSSPILMTAYYGRMLGFNGYIDHAKQSIDFDNDYPGLHIFLKRKGLPYSQTGRFQTEKQADDMEEDMLDFLKTWLEDKLYVFSAVEFDKIIEAIELEVNHN
jgi:hypothetical protein